MKLDLGNGKELRVKFFRAPVERDANGVVAVWGKQGDGAMVCTAALYPEIITGLGCAIRHPGDRDDLRVGRKLALGRALRALTLSKAERTAAWESFLAQSPRHRT